MTKDYKGCYWDKERNKFRSKIIVNGKQIHLGYFTNEENARQSYLEAKKIYNMSTNKCPTCDRNKSINKEFCSFCTRELKNIRSTNKCPTCHRNKSLNKETCSICSRNLKGISKTEDFIKLKEFICRIENRGGMASMQEVYIELITLYNLFGTDRIDYMQPNKQLEEMYKFLKNVNKKTNYLLNLKVKDENNN